MVFCLDEVDAWWRLRWFLHEADYLLSLAGQVEEGNLTAAEAFEAWSLTCTIHKRNGRA